MLAGSGDAERTAFLRTRGYRVLRFWNNEVLAETESVLEKIRLALLEPPPSPPAQAVEGKENSASGRD
jgi:very-short-patch-repair endonuclease